MKFSWLDISRSKVSLDNFGQLVLNILPSWQTSWIYHLTESQNSKSINRGKKCPLCVFLSIAWRKKCKQASAFFPSLVCLAIIRWTKRERKKMKRSVKCKTTAMPLNWTLEKDDKSIENKLGPWENYFDIKIWLFPIKDETFKEIYIVSQTVLSRIMLCWD